jgi:hypothetical protein
VLSRQHRWVRLAGPTCLQAPQGSPWCPSQPSQQTSRQSTTPLNLHTSTISFNAALLACPPLSPAWHSCAESALHTCCLQQSRDVQQALPACAKAGSRPCRPTACRANRTAGCILPSPRLPSSRRSFGTDLSLFRQSTRKQIGSSCEACTQQSRTYRCARFLHCLQGLNGCQPVLTWLSFMCQQSTRAKACIRGSVSG